MFLVPRIKSNGPHMGSLELILSLLHVEYIVEYIVSLVPQIRILVPVKLVVPGHPEIVSHVLQILLYSCPKFDVVHPSRASY